jgi:CRISPR-associated protein Csh1
MNLSQITAYIGENDNKKGEFGGLIKELNLKKVKDNQQAFVISMIFNVTKGEICFEILDKYQKGIEEQYHYFGNITGAGLQYYITRDISSIDYLFDEVWKGLKKKLEQHNMKNCSLYKELCIVDEDGNEVLKEVFLSAKTLRDSKGEKENETWIRSNIKDANKNDRFLLVIPIIRKSDGEEIILPNHPDYLKLVKVDKGLNDEGLNINNLNEKEAHKVCYICKEKKHGVTISKSANFSRSGINKVFETTTKRTARYQPDGFNYDDTYSFCNICYQRLLSGEKTITARFTTSIAGERVFIIPEALFGQFDYKHLYKVKDSIDLAFKKDVNNWIDDLESAAEIDQISGYSINLVFFRTPKGTSLSVLLTIEDIPTIYIKKVLQLLAKNSISLQPHVHKISLSIIYRIIPVKVNKKTREQVDISRVLTVYKAIFRKEQIKSNSLFMYVTEALDKGLKKLNKTEDGDNLSYSNIITGYSIGDEDFFIKRIIMSYLVLIKTCEDLNLLDKPIFKQNREEVASMTDFNSFSEKVNNSINEKETFLVKQGFTEPAKALFYLGVLINRVAVAQMLKEHRTKPILRKIQFQGMNIREIERLYHDVVEKLHQYNKMTLFTEAIMNRMHYYFDPLKNNWPLNDHENVFYLMSGYAYMVGNKPVDVSSDEAEVQESFNRDNDEENDE